MNVTTRELSIISDLVSPLQLHYRGRVRENQYRVSRGEPDSIALGKEIEAITINELVTVVLTLSMVMCGALTVGFSFTGMTS